MKRHLSSSATTTDVSISKTLSYLLRHGAHKENLRINTDGFMLVADLLEHKSLKNRCTLEDIKRIVKNNDKQRFSLRENHTGFPSNFSTEQFNAFLSTHGKVVESFYGKDNQFAIIQFDDAKVVKNLLNKRPTFNGAKLICKSRIIKPKQYVEQPEDHAVIDEQKVQEVQRQMNRIKNYATFDMQMNMLFNEIEAALPYMLPKYNQLCTHLRLGLSEAFPVCIPRPFGSTVTGLAFKTSDVDIFIDTGNSTECLAEPYAITFVRNAKAALMKNRLFTNVIAIPRAKTPIVKCVHSQTKINCDFNFKSLLGVCNSSLIKYFFSLDCRLRPVMMIIKYWAKVHDLTGHGRFSNYTLVMMYIFYLQQPLAVLPPIANLQTDDCVNIQEGWNAGFSVDPYLIQRTLNLHTASKLLEGFFRFYSTFDYGLKVICPFSGVIMNKSDFHAPEKLPACFHLYRSMINQPNNVNRPLRVDVPICVQDPFEQTHNLASPVRLQRLEDFQAYCKLATDICIEANRTTAARDLLPRLLVEKPEMEKQFECSGKEARFKIPLPASVSFLERLIPENVVDADKDKRIRVEWFKSVSLFMTTVLMNVFRFDVDIVTDATPGKKSQKLEGQTDIHDNDVVDSVLFSCKGKHNVWQARKQIARNALSNEHHLLLIDREIALSNYICDVLCEGINLIDTIVEFTLTLKGRVNPTEVDVHLLDTGSKKHNFQVMSLFFCNKIAMWYDKHVKGLNAEIGATVAAAASAPVVSVVNDDRDKKNDDDKDVIIIL